MSKLNKTDEHFVHSERPIYIALADHQTEEAWDMRDMIVELQNWVKVFNLEFKLEIPEIALCVDWLDVRLYGHFRYRHNGFGLRGELAINRCYLSSRPKFEILGTLLHELLHGWQQAHGKPGKRNYHNREFRTRALELGLIIDERGFTDFLLESPYVDLLKDHGIECPEKPNTKSVSAPLKPGSKLKKWTCGCTNVRVAVADFRARCLRCGQDFQIAQQTDALFESQQSR